MLNESVLPVRADLFSSVQIPEASTVVFSGQYELKEGLENRSEVVGTIDGVYFTGTPVYGICGGSNNV